MLSRREDIYSLALKQLEVGLVVKKASLELVSLVELKIVMDLELEEYVVYLEMGAGLLESSSRDQSRWSPVVFALQCVVLDFWPQ